MTHFTLDRLSKDILDLRVTDNGEEFSFLITDKEFDSLIVTIAELVENEPSRRSTFVETA